MSGFFWSFPHSRGDGPLLRMKRGGTPEFSPLAWGWSAKLLSRRVMTDVFPTRVGMVRWMSEPVLHERRFPHSRGDGPTWASPIEIRLLFSPLAWGWSVISCVHCARIEVFPTRVGMVRTNELGQENFASFPHSRGDGPLGDLERKIFTTFSPLAWGWSECFADSRNI